MEGEGITKYGNSNPGITIDSNQCNLAHAEYQYKIDSILRILNTGLITTKTALLIPFLLNTPQELEKITTKGQRMKLFKYCSNYLTHTQDDSFDLKNLVSELKRTSSKKQNFVDFELIKAIDLLNENKKFANKLPELIDNISPQGKIFFIAIEKFFQIFIKRLKFSAKDDANYEKFLHFIFHENEKLKQKITILKSDIQEKESNIQWKITEKQVLIEKYSRELNEKNEENDLKIQKEISTAQEKIQEFWNKNEKLVEKLRKEADDIEKKYKNLLTENITKEKVLREEKFKVLHKLEDAIARYDKNIGDYTNKKTQLIDEFNKKTKKFDDFFKEFEKQEIEYNDIVRRKEMEEKQRHEEMMMLFMMNRAARTIQRNWRKYLLKRKKKGKGKKGKKPKK